MSLSESTSLLPNRRRQDRNTSGSIRHPESQCRAAKPHVTTIILGAATIALLLLVTAYHQTNAPSLAVAKGHADYARTDDASARLTVDSRLERWDEWKANLWPNSAALENVHKNSESVDAWIGQVSMIPPSWDATTWWDETTNQIRQAALVQNAVDNAERFGDYVTAWWQSVEDDTKNSISSLSLGEKESALQHNFQNWWNTANQAERSWWQSVVQDLQHDKDVGASWVKAIEEQDEHVVQQSRDWMESAELVLEHDKQAVVNETETAWHQTGQFVENQEQAVSNEFALWWLVTKSVAQRSVNATTEMEDEWWNATKGWFRDHVRGGFWHNGSTSSHGTESAQQQQQQQQRPLLYLNSTIAYALLMNAYHWMDYSADFFLLQSGGWDVQINQAYCAVATVAAVLNSLKWQLLSNGNDDANANALPTDPRYAPYPYATQQSLLVDNACVHDTVIHVNETFDGLLHAPGGMTLGQAKGLLDCHLTLNYWNVTVQYVDPARITLNHVRRDLMNALTHTSRRVLVNYNRGALGQGNGGGDGGGHFSPIGGYSKQQDAFLIMDVAKYKYPPVWVPTERLYAGMATLDACGEWDYPTAQDLLLRQEDSDSDDDDNRNQRHRSAREKSMDRSSSSSSSRSSSLDEYKRDLKRLKCQPRYRGYIVVGRD